MPLTFSASPLPDLGAVLFSVGGGAAPYTITATPAGRSPYTVRGTWWESPAGVWSVVDGDLPLNTDVQYDLRDSSGNTASIGVQRVNSNDAMLSDALDPNMRVYATVVSQPPNTWEARTRWWDVLGRRDPFVSKAPLRLRGGDLVLAVATEDRRALLDLLASGSPLLLRTPRPQAVDDVFMAVETVREELHNDETPDGHRLFTLTYQAVSQDLGPYVPSSRTYASVKADAPTYGQLRYTFSDYVHLRTGQRVVP